MLRETNVDRTDRDSGRGLKVNAQTGRMEPRDRSTENIISVFPSKRSKKKRKQAAIIEPQPVPEPKPQEPVYNARRWADRMPGRIVFPRKPTLAMQKLPVNKINGRHRGKLIFIYGNGPSLQLAQRYHEELSHFPSIGIYVSYWLVHSSHILFADVWKMNAMVHSELLAQNSYVFCGRNPPDIPLYNTFARYRGRSFFSSDWSDGLCKAGNSLLPALNLAYIMGASEIALLGIDLHTPRHFYTNKEEYSTRPFFLQMGRRFWSAHKRKKSYPNANRIAGYCMKSIEFLKRRNIKVWNCSRGYSLKHCEKIRLKKLLASNL